MFPSASTISTKRKAAIASTKNLCAWIGACLPLGGVWAAPPEAVVATHLQAGERIVVDGHLSEAAWSRAAEYEVDYNFGPIEVKTTVPKTLYRVLTDDRNLYVGVRSTDPHPERIWRALARRDAVLNADMIGVFIDPNGKRKFAQVFRVAAGGAVRDGTYYEQSHQLDAAPDFPFESATSIDAHGWTLELKIPAESLRITGNGQPTILITRTYPRDYNFMFASTDIDERHDCVLCRNPVLLGVEHMTPGNSLTVTPYASLTRTTKDLGDATKGRVGADVKWRINGSSVVDITAWPDYSQVELDTPQLTANTRYALNYPEKRPFFLEGLDLFDTPLVAAYTRTLTKPAWGTRITHRGDRTDGVALAARDDGGGLVLLPKAFTTDTVSQPASTALIGRARFHIAGASAGLIGAFKDYGRYGNNSVAGLDGVYGIGDERFNAQALISGTSALGNGTELVAGERQVDSAEYLGWQHASNNWYVTSHLKRIGARFRDDFGFIEKAGLYAGELHVTRDIRPLPLFNRSVIYAYAEHSRTLDGATIASDYFLGMGGDSGNFHAELLADPWAQRRSDDGRPLHRVPSGEFSLSGTPTRWLPTFEFVIDFGHRLDQLSDRVGDGYAAHFTPTLLVFGRLRVTGTLAQEFIEDDEQTGGVTRTLLRDRVAEISPSYFFNANNELRWTYQYHDIYRDPDAFDQPVIRDDRTHLVSVVYTWSPALGKAVYVGGTWSSEHDGVNTEGSEFFVKLLWSF